MVAVKNAMRSTEKGSRWNLALAGLALALIVLLAWNLAGPREFSIAAPFTLSAAQNAESDAPTAVELTIYQAPSQPAFYGYAPAAGGFALVKETRSAQLPSGLTLLSLKNVATQLDATTLRLTDKTSAQTTVLQQSYDYDLVSQQKLLARSVGQRVTATKDGQSYEGTLLSAADGLVLQTAAGVVALASHDAASLAALPQGLKLEPTVTWLLDSKQAGAHELEIAYVTAGISWSATYVAELNANQDALALSSWASIDNNVGAFKDARVTLVAGDVNRLAATQPPSPYPVLAEAAVSRDAGPPFTQEAFSEFHAFHLQRPVSLDNAQSTQLAFVNAPSVRATKALVYPGSGTAVLASVEFTNDAGNGLGTPLPSGVVRVYQRDAGGSLQFTGEDAFPQTPEGKAVRVRLGRAFDVTAEKTQVDQARVSNCVQQGAWRVELRNAKDRAETIVVQDNFYGQWTVLQESLPSEKKSASLVEWRVPVPAKGTAVLAYRVQQTYC